MSCDWMAAMIADWGATETVALGSLAVAVWAGWSAHRSAQEAKRANAQAMYHERRAVFDAFLDLSMHMQCKGQAPDLDVVRLFYRHQHTAVFCLDEALAKELKDYYDAAFKLADFSRVSPGLPRLPKDESECHDHVKAMSEPLLEKLKKAVPVK